MIVLYYVTLGMMTVAFLLVGFALRKEQRANLDLRMRLADKDGRAGSRCCTPCANDRKGEKPMDERIEVALGLTPIETHHAALKHFKVERDESDPQYDVIWPDGDADEQSFNEEHDAHHFAQALEHAYELGESDSRESTLCGIKLGQGRVRDLFYRAGICIDCGEELTWDGEGPHVSCKCGTREITDSKLPTIPDLRRQIAGLQAERAH